MARIRKWLKWLVVWLLPLLVAAGWVQSELARTLVSYYGQVRGNTRVESNRGAIYVLVNPETYIYPVGGLRTALDEPWMWDDTIPGHTVRRWQGVQVFAFRSPSGLEKGTYHVLVISYWLLFLLSLVPAGICVRRAIRRRGQQTEPFPVIFPSRRTSSDDPEDG